MNRIIIAISLLVVVTVVLAFTMGDWFTAYGAIDESGQISEVKPELKCLSFNDGKLAIITIAGGTGGAYLEYNGFINACNGYVDTLKWFLSKGYKINATNTWSIYLTR